MQLYTSLASASGFIWNHLTLESLSLCTSHERFVNTIPNFQPWNGVDGPLVISQLWPEFRSAVFKQIKTVLLIDIIAFAKRIMDREHKITLNKWFVLVTYKLGHESGSLAMSSMSARESNSFNAWGRMRACPWLTFFEARDQFTGYHYYSLNWAYIS